MTRRGLIAGIAVAAALAAPQPALAGQVKAGVAAVDASWHVGSSAGQYASDGSFVSHEDGTFDPFGHSTRRRSSYGIQSRLQVRALVVQGPDGKRFAVVKNDLYIPQDLVYRRAGQILRSKPDLRIGPENLTMAVSHNHSSPFYSSTSWGVWAFQDVFDVRFFNYYAERMAEAVQGAAARMVPVRVGASVSSFDKTHRHSYGPARADDGTPAGYPQDNTDHDLTVVRFDDISNPGRPKPLANLVNFSLHPEFLDGNDLISEDYLAPLEAIADRATGAMTVFTQGAVGTAEPERSTYHPIEERLEFTHREYGQAEYGARLMANAIVDTWRDIERRTPEQASRFVPPRSDFGSGDVRFDDRWFPGPVSHPYPGVSNCRSDPIFGGDPRVPVVGLPDCVPLSDGLNQLADLAGLPDPPDPPPPPIDPGLTTDDFQRLGIPVPENYSAPAYTGLHEDIDVHLQAFRIGDILFTVCSCEQWLDQSENIETRTDRVAGNEHLGYDWKKRCTKNRDGSYGDEGADENGEGYGTGTWSCPPPANPAEKLPDQAVERMHRQVTNPANGWNDPENVATAESEPTDLKEIKGNYTHDDDAESARLGYRLTVPIGMGNDYNGYIASYREYQRGDHYRKALTGWGPHSSDYMATRLVNMGRAMNGGDEGKLLPDEPGQQKVPADLAVNEARAQALGEGGGAATRAYEAALPDDGGEARPLREPADVERFDGTFFTWNGGSNYTDDPRVRVQRRLNGAWRDYAGQSGEVPVTIEYPEGTDAPSFETGSFEWRWTAHFEAFASGFETVEGNRATPAGEYRFVVEGRRREGRRAVPYRVESAPFEVRPWDGIAVEDLRREPDGRVSFRVGPTSRAKKHAVIDRQAGDPAEVAVDVGPIDYPDSYDYGEGGPLPRFIRNRPEARLHPQARTDLSRAQLYCFDCRFRPWVDAGDAARATVAFVGDGGATQVAARKEGDRWVTERPLPVGQRAVVGSGCVRDAYGNFNGRGAALGGASAAAPSCSQPAGGGGGPRGPGGGGGRSGAGGSVGDAVGSACTRPRGRLSGRRLGPFQLGRRRATNRRAARAWARRRRAVDRFCLTDGRHVRIGYASRKLVRRLGRRERRRVRGRALLALTSSRRYRARGVRVGAGLRTLRRRAPGLSRGYRIGKNVWYLARGRSARLVFKVRRGRVREVGIADRRLTGRGRRLSRAFLRSFS